MYHLPDATDLLQNNLFSWETFKNTIYSVQTLALPAADRAAFFA